MKKLLTLFGVTLISTVAATSVISCIPNLNENEAGSSANNLEIFNGII